MPKLEPRRVKRQPEASLTDKIRAAVNALDGVRIWRNNTGIATHVKEQGIYKMRYGLGVGSPDLVGIMRAYKGLGCFLGIEVKRPGEEPEPEQEEWRTTIERFGGIYIVAHSEVEACDLVNSAR